MTTALVWDESYFWQRSEVDLGPWIEGRIGFESPAPRRRLLNLVHASGLDRHLTPVRPVPLTRDAVLRFHTPAYVERLERIDVDGGEAGELAAVGPGSYTVALLSAGGCVEAVRAVVEGRAGRAYALVRPPGHHAEADRGRGYCLLGNVALAVLAARAEFGVGRVAVIDWDVHHGNGTEQAFWDEPEVLTVSLHQDRHYPEDTGALDAVGGPHARGANINVPLPPGSGRGAYRAAFERVVAPAVRAHDPELIVVASGYDASGIDPLGRMMLSAAEFGAMTRSVIALADDLCGGRVVVCQEGGYSEIAVPFCGLRVLEALTGAGTGVPDPVAWIDDLPGQELTGDQDDVVERVAAAHRSAGG